MNGRHDEILAGGSGLSGERAGRRGQRGRLSMETQVAEA